MSRSKFRKRCHNKPVTSRRPGFDSTRLHPANFAGIGWVGRELVVTYTLDCALNQGIATGVPLMGEGIRTLPLAAVEAAIPPGHRLTGQAKANFSGRPRPHAVLVEHPSQPVKYALVAGGELVQAAVEKGATHLDCVVVPYVSAMKVGRALIDDFVRPPNGYVALPATTPPYASPKHAYVGKDGSEESDSANQEGKSDQEDESGRTKDWYEKWEEGLGGETTAHQKPHPKAAPAVSQSGIGHGIDPQVNMLLALAIHTVTVEDGEVVVRAHSTLGAANAMLGQGDQAGLDIIIKHDQRKAGAPGLSLHEFALTLFLYHLFNFAGDVIVIGDGRRSGHSVVQAKQGPDYWPGSPTCYQSWIDKRAKYFTATNPFWDQAIPKALFKRCVALRYGVAAPTPAQLEGYFYELVQAAFKALDLAGRQTSNLRALHRPHYAKKRRPLARPVIDRAVDGVEHPAMGANYQVNEIDRYMLAVLSRANPAKIFRDKSLQTLMYQWLVAIGDLARTGKMIVTCLMAQEFVIVERERKAERSIDAGWMVFGAILAEVVDGRASENRARRELRLLCEQAMSGSYGMIVSHTSWGKASLVSTPLDRPNSVAAEIPILLF